MEVGKMIDSRVIQPVKPFEMDDNELFETWVYENNRLNQAFSYGGKDWEQYCSRYGIENTIDFSIGEDSDPIYCDFFKIKHKDFRYCAFLTINGVMESVFIKELPDLFDFMHYIGSTIKLLAQSKYRTDKIQGMSVDALKVEGWGIGDDE